jgi:hypothetical protein
MKEDEKPFWPPLKFTDAQIKRTERAHKLLKEEQAKIDKACAERIEQWRKDKIKAEEKD